MSTGRGARFVPMGMRMSAQLEDLSRIFTMSSSEYLFWNQCSFTNSAPPWPNTIHLYIVFENEGVSDNT